ncbi:MAG: alkaline phosphatase family protein [Chloroflexota bacterium]
METIKKVIVLGLDGFEPKVVASMLRSGQLPNLAKLRSKGGFSTVQTTYPALTPAAWSTFATGTNPGGHGIFEFVHRDPNSYYPILALNRHEQKNPFLPPKAVNMRHGTPLWQLLSDAGISSTIVRCPCTYPPDKIFGRMLAGVGVPDLRGGLGTSTFYSSAEDLTAQESEHVVTVSAETGGTISTYLIGPRNPRGGNDIRSDIKLHLQPAASKLTVQSDGQPKSLEVRQGEWSDWLKVKFKVGPLQSVRGMVRFYLVQLEPVLELYASPVNFDPDSPLFPISSPPEYASELASKLGTFYTAGMAEDHGGLNNGRFDETAFLQQCDIVLRERVRMMLYELERFDTGLFFCLFDTPDRLAHMFWRFGDSGFDSAGGETEEARHAIESHYQACDAIVGEALKYVDDQTLLIVLSDHGMDSFQRGVHLNTWLHDNGLLTLRDGISPGELAGDFLRGVDWSRTRAYALGLGGIYLNLHGREAQGIVTLDDTEHLKTSIVQELTGLVDFERDKVAVRSVLTREQVYSGPYLSEAPDLLVNFSAGYRVSWGTPLGGVPAGLFEDNPKKWTGDHAIDPSLVPGVLFMNRPIRGDRPSLVDLAPTILAALGVPKGPAMEGRSLLE